MRFLFLWLFFVLCGLVSFPVLACTNPDASPGEIIYSSAYDDFQGCTPNGWVSFNTPLIGPSDCPDIGDQCGDGTIFAGYHPASYQRLFITPTYQGGVPRWTTASGTDNIATDSLDDGRSNSSQIPDSATFPAFQACKSLNLGGHTDWYLPSKDELNYLYTVRAQIESGPSVNFTDAWHWSSSEFNNSTAWAQTFSDGHPDKALKTNNNLVRCMRR